MVELIRYLHNKDLAILRVDEFENTGSDIIFYFYNEMNEMEIKEKEFDEFIKNGINIISIKDLLEEIDKQNKKLIENISFEYDYEYLLYNLFGYFLYIKLTLREIQNIAYSKGLTKISYIIAKDEENIAYEFSQYLLNEWDYNKVLESDILDIVNDKDKFIKYYKIFKDKISKYKLDKDGVKWAYEDLKEEFKKNN